MKSLCKYPTILPSALILVIVLLVRSYRPEGEGPEPPPSRPKKRPPIELTAQDVYTSQTETFVTITDGAAAHVEALYVHCPAQGVDMSPGVWAFRPGSGQWAQELSVPGGHVRFDWPLNRMPTDLRGAMVSRPQWLPENAIVSVLLKADATEALLHAQETGATEMHIGAEYKLFKDSSPILLPERTWPSSIERSSPGYCSSVSLVASNQEGRSSLCSGVKGDKNDQY